VFTEKDAKGKPTITRTTADGDGNLFKFNVNYKFTDDIMAYATVSEGFRLGGTNGIGSCPEGASTTVPIKPQKLCALPSEVAFDPDSTTNYELGFKSTWFNNQLHFNAAIFNVDWDDAQVGGAATVNGNLPYTTNAGTANSKGLEISSRALLSDSLTAFATFSYAKAELTTDVFGLFKELKKTDPAYYEYSGQDGDRLPGSPEKQFSMGLNYTQDLFDDKVLDVVYGMTYQSDVYTNVGLKAESEALSGFALSNLSATISSSEWAVTLYVDNMFNKYAFTSARSTGKASGFAEFPEQISNKNTTGMIRSYGHYVTAPRTIRLKFNYLFDM
jgi:iron complex outermembrane receptor protein